MPLMDNNQMRYLGTVQDEPGRRLRYMKRRRTSKLDRNGDPLEGIVNLFDVSIVLAVGFLVMALSGLGMSGVLTSRQVTIVTNPGTPQMQVVMKNGDQIKKLNVTSGPTVSGVGSLMGSFYQLGDGTVVYVPASAQSAAAGSSTTPGTTTPQVTPTPGVSTTPYVTPTPTTSAAGTGVTITPTPND
jgi:hypothetical protein